MTKAEQTTLNDLFVCNLCVGLDSTEHVSVYSRHETIDETVSIPMLNLLRYDAIDC